MKRSNHVHEIEFSIQRTGEYNITSIIDAVNFIHTSNKDLFLNRKQSDTARLFANHGYKIRASWWVILLKSLIFANNKKGSCKMKKISNLFFTLIFSLPISAFNYRPELDGEGGLFIVNGDDSISGIIMFIGCVAISFICYKIAGIINNDEESKGIKKTTSTILYIISTIACITAVGFAFALWWIILILVVIIAICGAIYEKMKKD